MEGPFSKRAFTTARLDSLGAQALTKEHWQKKKPQKGGKRASPLNLSEHEQALNSLTP